MIKKIQQYYLFLGLLLFSLGAYAQSQNYPITGAGSFIPQNSLSWFGLYTSPALNFNLYLKDASSTPGAIFARMRLSRVGIEIYNPASFVGTKGFTVNFGQPLQLSGMDLVENFRPQNLEASGVSENLFTQGGVLPNGIWTLELVFYEQDPARNYRQVSDKITVSFTVTNGQAPLLNLPSNESEIDARYGQNIGFAWTPRGTSLSGAGGLTYNFTLWELGEDENPYDVAEGKTPIYTSSVSVPMLAYDPTKPLLQVGKHYAWQVQVVDPFGNNVYENNGKSEIWEFRYGLKCEAPALNFKSVGSGYTEIYWDKINQAQSYDLRWRIQGTNEYNHYITSGTYHRLAFEKNQVYEVELQSQCYGGENSEWTSSNYPQASPMMLRTMSATTSSSESSATPSTPINPADIPVNGADVDPKVYDDLVNTLNAEPKSEIRCGKVNQTSVFACEPDDVSDYQGTKDFTSKTNGTFYVNGYDVRITKVVNQTSGEGLLYMPLFGQRIPVVWSGITLKEGEGKDYMGNPYGCLIAGEVIVAGSNPNLISGDLTTQYQALYNSLNSPGSYSGTFGQAVADMGLIAQELLDKIAKGTPIEPSDYQRYNSVCNAVKKGMDDWKKKLVDKYGDSPKFPEFQRLYSSIDNIKTSLLNEIDCDRQGKLWKRTTDDSEVLYASTGMPYLDDFYLKNPCKIALTQSKSSELKDLLSTAVNLEKQPLDANLTDKPSTSPDLPTALSLLTQLQLTTSYAQGHGCEDYKFVDFKEGCLYSSGSSLTPSITYFGKPTTWKTPLPLWLVNNVWVSQTSDTPLAFKYYNSSDLKWYDLPLPAGKTAGEAFADVFAKGFAVLLSAGVGLGAQTAVVAEQTAQRCIINGSIDLLIQGILYGGWEAYQQGKLPQEVLPLVWDRISLISVAGSCGTGIIDNCGAPCQSFSTGLIAGVQDIYDQYKQTKDLSKVNYNLATMRAATAVVIAGLLNSGLSFSRFSLSSTALFGTKLAWLRPKLFANLMTLTRADRTQLAEALQNVTEDVLTRLENPTFFMDFSKAILVSGSTPSSGIFSSLSRLQSWVNSWLGIKDKALKWVRSTTLSGTLGIMTLAATSQVEARIIDNSGIIETVMRVPNVASGLINESSSEVSSMLSKGISVAEVEASQILDQTGESLSSSSGTYEILQNQINSDPNILISLKPRRNTAPNSNTAPELNTPPQPIVLIKGGKTYKIGDDSKCVYCGKTILKPASGSDATEYTLCQDLNRLQARGGTNGTAGVTKLCSAFPTVAGLRPIVTKLLTFTSGEVQAFYGDIAPSTCGGSAYLCGNVGSLTVGLIDAWSCIATNANNLNTNYLNDFVLLKKVQEIQSDATKRGYFVSNTTVNFDAFLVNALKETPCNTCPEPADGTWASRFPKLDKILSNMLELVPKHTSKADFRSSFYNGEVLAGNPSSIAKRDGGQHMLNYMADRPFTDNAIWIDRKFSYVSAQAANSGKEFDIYMGREEITPIWFVECKSYQESTDIDVEQFLAYLSLIDDFSRLRYVFNDRKLDITAAKNKMKAVFQGSKANDIFDEIWKNNPLRTKLFGTNLTKIQARTQYDLWLNSLDNTIFIFVDVHY